MATANGRLSLSLTDPRGGRGTFMAHIQLSDALTVADASAAIAIFAALYESVGDATVEFGTFSLVETAVANAGAADADIASGAVFDFSNAVNPSTYGQWVPSFKDSLVAAGGHIDISAGANAAFVAAMEGAVLGGRYANAQYIPNNAGLDAFLSSRKRSKRVR